MGHFFSFLVSKAFWINLLVIIGLGVVGVFGVMRYLTNYTNHGEVVKVPDFYNLTLSEAQDKIPEGAHFMLEISDSLYKKGLRAGQVIEQSPKKNAEVKEGRRIYLTVAASHPPMITMPNLKDHSLRQALSLMETYGLKVGELIYKPDLCTNCILEQEINGETVTEGTKIVRGSTIDLIIGQGLGDELTGVPYLLGMGAAAAELLLEAKFLNAGVFLYDDEVKTKEDSMNAVIYYQSPAYSTEPIVRMGTPIDLFLSTDTNKVPTNVIPADTLY